MHESYTFARVSSLFREYQIYSVSMLPCRLPKWLDKIRGHSADITLSIIFLPRRQEMKYHVDDGRRSRVTRRRPTPTPRRGVPPCGGRDVSKVNNITKHKWEQSKYVHSTDPWTKSSTDQLSRQKRPSLRTNRSSSLRNFW